MQKGGNAMKKIIYHFVVLMVAILTGCASIVSKSMYAVNINSTPDGADITITDEVGNHVFTGKTPTVVTLKTKRGYFKGKDYNVTFKKSGYDSHSAVISRKVDGWYIYGNLLFGGLIGWLIVDPAPGAMWKLEEDVSATLTSQTSSLNPEEQSLKIVHLEDVPEYLIEKMIPVK